MTEGLIHTPEGIPDTGWTTKEIGPNIDTTNPEAAKWRWDSIRDRYLKPYGFDYLSHRKIKTPTTRCITTKK